MQKLRTPDWLNAAGAELDTKASLVPPLVEKPFATNTYPLLVPLESTLSMMHAVVELGAHPEAGPPRFAKAAA
jgi:hypothetical protein